MRAVVAGPQDRERYTDFVKSSPKGHILQSWEWGELKAATGWVPLRVMVEDDDGTIKAAISVLRRPLPIPGRSIMYAPRGPVGDLGDRRTLAVLLDLVHREGRRHGAVFLKIDPDIPETNETLDKTLRSLGFRRQGASLNFEGIQPRFVFRLPLTNSLDEIWNAMAPKTRYNIRLAERRGVEVTDGGKEDIPVFYRILEETARRDHFLIRSESYFHHMWDALGEHGYARLFLARYAGEVIAGTLALTFGDKTWYLYGASSNRHRNVMPNYALQWAMIKWAKENGCTLYDFRGVSGDLNPDNPLYGLYRFKKGFGGELVAFLGEYDQVYQPLWYWLWQNAVPAYRRLRRRLRQGRAKEEPEPALD